MWSGIRYRTLKWATRNTNQRFCTIEYTSVFLHCGVRMVAWSTAALAKACWRCSGIDCSREIRPGITIPSGRSARSGQPDPTRHLPEQKCPHDDSGKPRPDQLQTLPWKLGPSPAQHFVCKQPFPLDRRTEVPGYDTMMMPLVITFPSHIQASPKADATKSRSSFCIYTAGNHPMLKISSSSQFTRNR